MDLQNFPQVNLFHRPTPLEEMKRLQKAVQAKPRLYIKRDDLTGAGLGGNKNRKLDFLLAQARTEKATTLITCGGLQSNHCRQTLAAARRLGMECHLILKGEAPEHYIGNLLIYKLMGAQMHYIGVEGDADEAMEELARHLKQKGERPYIIPLGGSTPLGSLGYMQGFMELSQQIKDTKIVVDHVVLATGSCGTHAGALIGAREGGLKATIHGISVSRSKEQLQKRTALLMEKTYALLEQTVPVDPDSISIFDTYIGEGYARLTREGKEAMELFARHEGLLLDPVYTGKGASGMLDLLKRGFFDQAQGVLFLHTGGFPATHAFHKEIGSL